MYGGGENGRGGVRVERVAAGSGYVDGGAAAAVAAAVAEWEAERARNRGAGETETETTLFSASPSLDLPAQSCRAVATAFDWLRQFGLDGMIRLAPAFRRMSECGEMRLTPNVLRQLEILQSAEGAHRGSLLWLMGSNAVTAAGGRLLRRWIAHPLTGRAAIEARLEAVAELRDEAEEGGGGALAGLVPALRASHGGAAGDAERYLARVFHGTATPAELVAALAAVRDFAASVNGMRRGAVFGAKLENTSSTPMTQTPRDEFGEVAKATALRELLGEAADPAVSEVCRALLSAVDVEAARGVRRRPRRRCCRTRDGSLNWRGRAAPSPRGARWTSYSPRSAKTRRRRREMCRGRGRQGKVTRPSTGVRHRRAGGTPDRASGYASRGAHDVDARVDE